MWPCPWPPNDPSKCLLQIGDDGIHSITTTSFQIEQVSTTTSQFPASEIDVVQVLTDVDGHATRTNLQTRIINGEIFTITNTATSMVTATGNVGGRVWVLLPTSGSSVTAPISTLEPASTPNQHTPTVTITTTEYLSTGNSVYSGSFVTLINSGGSTTATVTMKLDTLTDSLGRPTTTVTEEILMNPYGTPISTIAIESDTLTNSSDGPTFITEENLSLSEGATLTTETHINDPSAPTMATPTSLLETIIDSNGLPLQTITVSPETLTDTRGLPTATFEAFTASVAITGPVPWASKPSNNATIGLSFAHPVQAANYFVVSFLPVFVAILLSILIQTINKNVKTMLPFFALSKVSGALARDSINLVPGGLVSPLHSIRLLFRFREPVSLLCDVLALLIAILVTISSEAIGIKLYGSCDTANFAGCTMYFDVFDGPSRTAEGLMIAIAVIIACIGICLYPIRSGVTSNSWTIASTASLLSRETAELLQSIRQDDERKIITAAQIAKHLENRKFAFGFYLSERATTEYGIVVRYRDPLSSSTPTENDASSLPSKVRLKKDQQKSNRKYFPKKLLQFIIDQGFGMIFLALLCGLLILVVYYDAVQLDASNNSFERFIDSQKFGVRSLFAGCGVIISFFWDDIFSRTYFLLRLNYFPPQDLKSMSISSTVYLPR
jgi:hypothetical protein